MEAQGEGRGPAADGRQTVGAGESGQQGAFGLQEETRRIFSKDSRGGDRRKREAERRRAVRRKRVEHIFFFQICTAILLVSIREAAAEHTFKAIDCAQPLATGTLEIPMDCGTGASIVKTKLADRERVGLFKVNKAKPYKMIICSAQISRFVHGCGMWSHEYFSTPHTILRPRQLTVEQCMWIASTGTYKEGKRLHIVKPMGTSYINYLEAGDVHFENKKGVCRGGKLIMDNEEIEGVVSSVDVKITVKTILARDTEKGKQIKIGQWTTTVDGEEGAILPDGRGTVIWRKETNKKSKDSKCQLEKLGLFDVVV
jgi:hypothetical protein